MEIEQAIVLALSEPLRYDKLLTKARELLKTAGKKLYRQTFNDTLKILVSDGWIKRNPKKDGTVVYELADSKIGRSAKKFFKDYQDLQDKKIGSVLESLAKIFEEISENQKNKIKISSYDKTKYELIILFALLLWLEYQKQFFFWKNNPLGFRSVVTTSADKIKKIENMFSIFLKPISKALGKDSLSMIYETAIMYMELSIDGFENTLKGIEEFYKEKK